jgi:hypothetical protein
VVLVANREFDIEYINYHAEFFIFKEKITVLIDIALAVNSFIGSIDCYGNITAEFEK